MGSIKSLWDAVQGDATFMRRLNGWLTMFWVAMIPISFMLGWLNSVTYVSALSLWALVAGHVSTWQAGARRSDTGERSETKTGQPVEDRVVDELVAETTVEESS